MMASQSWRMMFLGLLLILAGGLWLLSLIWAVPVGSALTLNPFIAILTPPYEGITSGYLREVAPLIQTGESLAFLLIGVGVLLGIVGCFRKVE